MTIDLTKPLELFNPTTGEVRDATFHNRYPHVASRFAVRPSVMSSCWTDYHDDGTAVMRENPWTIRNKVDVNLDLTKPLYVDGVRVYLTTSHDRDDVAFWQRMWDIDSGYINVSKYRNRLDQVDNSTFMRKTLKHQVATGAIQGTISNNPGEIKMLDLNKPLVVNGKDAKVVHKFDNGNLAVIVDGYGEVQNYTSDGKTRGGTYGGQMLVNKVVETVRFVNVYPGRNTRGGSTHIHDDLSAALDGIGQQRKTAGAVMVKQTLIDGKVVKSELVD